MDINKIKQHKILTFFNFLALALIVIGSSTDFLVPSSGTSISGAIATWGGLLLICALIIDGIVVVRHSNIKPNNQGTNTNIALNAYQQKMSKIKGISIILGVLVGLVAAYFFSGAGNAAAEGSDMAAGFVFIFLAPIFAALGAFILFTLAKLSFGVQGEKKSAIKWFIIVAVVLAAYIGYSYYEDEYGQKYCDGQPIEQYQGELPGYCLNQ